MKKLLLVLALLLAPVQASAYFSVEGENPVFTRADQDFLREMLKIQKRSGDIISNIGANWDLKSDEIDELPQLSIQLSLAIRDMRGMEKSECSVIPPKFTDNNARLLQRAAELQVQADNLILKMIEQKSVDRLRFERLRDAMTEIAQILNQIEDN